MVPMIGLRLLARTYFFIGLFFMTSQHLWEIRTGRSRARGNHFSLLKMDLEKLREFSREEDLSPPVVPVGATPVNCLLR